MMQGNLVVVVGALLLAACSGPSVPEPDAKQPATGTEIVQLGGPATGAGTLTADAGEYRPADPTKFHKEPGYSPYAGRRYPERPYFGDEHVHTGWSADAGMDGATTTPEDAFRFARGDEVKSNSGLPANVLRSSGSWVAMPTGQVFRWQTRIITQPITTSGAGPDVVG